MVFSAMESTVCPHPLPHPASSCRTCYALPETAAARMSVRDLKLRAATGAPAHAASESESTSASESTPSFLPSLRRGACDRQGQAAGKPASQPDSRHRRGFLQFFTLPPRRHPKGEGRRWPGREQGYCVAYPNPNIQCEPFRLATRFGYMYLGCSAGWRSLIAATCTTASTVIHKITCKEKCNKTSGLRQWINLHIRNRKS